MAKGGASGLRGPSPPPMGHVMVPMGKGKGKGVALLTPAGMPSIGPAPNGIAVVPRQVPAPGAMVRGRSPPAPMAVQQRRPAPGAVVAPVPAGSAPMPAAPQAPRVAMAAPAASVAPSPAGSFMTTSQGPAPPPQQAGQGQIAGTVVTKTTVEKMFIPSDPNAPAVQLGGPGAQVASHPGAVAIAQAPVMQPVMQGQQVEQVMVPAISGSGAMNGAPAITAASPMAAEIAPHYVPIPQAGYVDGMHSSSYAPHIYQIDDQMDNQGNLYQQSGYQIDGQGAWTYQNEVDMLQYQQYQEDQHFNEMQMPDQQNQQFADGFYVNDYADEAQVDAARYALSELPSYNTSPEHNNFHHYEVDADAAAGIPRPQEEKPDDSPAEDQFTRLLNSLEARVDLMAQMQHTRAEIQKHTRNLQNNKTQSRSLSPPHMDGGRIMALTEKREPPMVELEPERPFSNMVSQFQEVGIQGNGFEPDAQACQITSLSGAGARLVRENAILRNEFEDQRSSIDRLQNEVAGMRSQLRSLSVEPPTRDGGVIDRSAARIGAGADILGVGTRVEARWMKDDGSGAAFGSQWMSGYISKANEDGTFQVEYDNGAACLRVPSHCVRPCGEADAFDSAAMLGHAQGGVGEAPFPDFDDDPNAGEEVKELQMALLQERRRHESSTQQWWRERRRLLDELSTLKASSGPGRRALGNLPTVGESAEVDSGFSSMLNTNPVLPANGLHLSGSLAPLSRNPCGMNIELSEDGYTAKRIRGCRQSVVVGSAPLELQELGHYFEVVVRETVNGWVGGLGIGVTRMSPAELRRMPDKAWRIPNTFIVGYWGCLFLDGREKRTRWKADTLTVGSRVGLLVTGDGRGDLIVFVDGEPVVRADDVLPTSGLHSDELYPVIDVFAATLAVELQQNAVAPPKPWSKDPSPPGSPASAARSVCSSTVSVGTRQSTFSIGPQSAMSFNG